MNYSVIKTTDALLFTTMSDAEIRVVETLTSEQLEYAFRVQQLRYRMEDAECQCEMFAETREEYAEVISAFDETDYLELAKRFIDSHDCNIPENDLWYGIVADYVRQAKGEA